MKKREQTDLLVVVEPTLGDEDRIHFVPIDKAVFLGDSTRPISGESVLKRLRLTDPLEGIALDVFDQSFDAGRDRAVAPAPIAYIFLGAFGPPDFNAAGGQSRPRFP